MEEVNFVRLPYLVNHTISAIKNDTVILLGRSSSKSILLYYIIRELHQINGKKCALLHNNEGVTIAKIKAWIKSFTYLKVAEVNSFVSPSQGNELNKQADVIILDIKTSVDTFKQCVKFQDVGLLLLTTADCETINLVPSLTLFSCLCNQFDGENCEARKVACIPMGIDKDIRPAQLTDLIQTIRVLLPFKLSLGTDLLPFGNEGNLLKMNMHISKPKTCTCPQQIFALQGLKTINRMLEIAAKLYDSQLLNQNSELFKNAIAVMKHIGMVGLVVALSQIRESLKQQLSVDTNENISLLLECCLSHLNLIHIVNRSLNLSDSVDKSMISLNMQNLLDILLAEMQQVQEKHGFDLAGDNDLVSEKSKAPLTSLNVCVLVDSQFMVDTCLNMFSILQDQSEYNFLKQCRWENVFLYSKEYWPLKVCFIDWNSKKNISVFDIDIVISLVVPENYQNYLKLKNIASNRFAKVIFLLMADDEVEQKRLRTFQDIENVFAAQCEDYIYPDQVDLSNTETIEALKSFQPNENWTRSVSPAEAISIVNKYCKILSTRSFSSAAPIVSTIIIEDSDRNQISATTRLHLPIKSMVKEIIQSDTISVKGQSSKSQISATLLSRMSAGLKACEYLYSTGELNDDLEPTRKYVKKVQGQPHKNEDSEDILKVLAQRKAYEQTLPSIFEESFPQAGEPVFLYVVNFETLRMAAQKKMESKIAHPKYLGFCIAKRLPKIPSFVLYDRYDELNVHLEEVSNNLVFNSDQLNLLYTSHCFFFKHILSMKITLKLTHPVSGFLWTSLSKEGSNFTIDYNFLKFIQENSSLDLSSSLLPTMKVHIHVSEQDAVVLPAHVNPSRRSRNIFYAADISSDLTTESPFPDPSVATTFADYYLKTYDVTLKPNQPLIQCEPIHKRLNLLHQRYPLDIEQGVSASKRIDRSRTFLPLELCLVHPIPKHFWRLFVRVPSISYRLGVYLLADDFRGSIYDALGLTLKTKADIRDESLDLTFRQETLSRDKTLSLSSKGNKEFQNKTLKSGCEANTDVRNLSASLEQAAHHYRPCISIKNLDVLKGYKVFGIVPNVSQHYACYQIVLSISNVYTNVPLSNPSCQVVVSEASVVKCEAEMDKSATYGTESNSNFIKEGTLLSSSILTAFTSPESLDQFDFESFEFIGDSFLSAWTATDLFLHLPNAHENILSRRNGEIVSNLNLFETGDSFGLGKYVLSEPFIARKNPLISRLYGICDVCEQKGGNARTCSTQHSMHHSKYVRKKSLSDSVEALIGVVFLFLGREMASVFLRWLGLNVCNCLPDRGCKNKFPAISNAEVLPNQYLKTNAFSDSEDQEEWHCNHCSTGTACKRMDPVTQKTRADVLLEKGSQHTASVAEIAYFEDSRDRKCKNINCVSDTPKVISSTDIDFQSIGLVNKVTHINDDSPIKATKVSSEERELCIYGDKSSEKCYTCLPSHFKTAMTLSNGMAPEHWMITDITVFEESVSYTFCNKMYYVEAFAHPAYSRILNPSTFCNQRLEFLGDAVLNHLVADFFCRSRTTESNSELTELRAATVHSRTFAIVATLHGFHKHLKFLSPKLSYLLRDWLVVFEEMKRTGNFWEWEYGSAFVICNETTHDNIEVPKPLADVFEAVAGAIFIDSGLNFDAVWKVYYPMLKPAIDYYQEHSPTVCPTRKLNETSGYNAIFKQLEQSPDGNFNHEVTVPSVGVFRGSGRTPKVARAVAASRALEKINASASENLVTSTASTV